MGRRRGQQLRGPRSGASPGSDPALAALQAPLPLADARQRTAGGGHSDRGAGAPSDARLLGALSCSQRRLLGRARPAVTSARLPPPPSHHPDQCGMEGAEASCEGRSAPLPGASFLRPACLPAFPGESRRHSIPSFPPRRQAHPEPPPPTWEVIVRGGLEASLAALSLGIRPLWGEWRGGRMEGTSTLWTERGRFIFPLQKCWLS